MSERVLIAGIGNIFLGDDGFGVEVAQRLAQRELPEGVEAADFGIRGLDLAYALGDGYEAVVFVDATPRGKSPGTVTLIEPHIEDDGEVTLDTHGMDPVKVIKLARALGARMPRLYVVGCEPQNVVSGEEFDDMVMELSRPVSAAVEEAARMAEELAGELCREGAAAHPGGQDSSGRGGESA